MLPHRRKHPMNTTEPIGEHSLLDEVTQGDIRLARFALYVVSVESRPAHAGDFAGMVCLEALKLHPAPDLSVDAVPPDTVFFRRDSFTGLEALRRKSRASARWPLVRSSSAT